eukprot:snap_masked-scaffold_46-processed-gene-1.80-mRNA-1 protein AED:1.00 eAED:1.00 QI:0/0/0/0/1/1/2/0/252
MHIPAENKTKNKKRITKIILNALPKKMYLNSNSDPKLQDLIYLSKKVKRYVKIMEEKLLQSSSSDDENEEDTKEKLSTEDSELLPSPIKKKKKTKTKNKSNKVRYISVRATFEDTKNCKRSIVLECCNDSRKDFETVKGLLDTGAERNVGSLLLLEMFCTKIEKPKSIKEIRWGGGVTKKIAKVARIRLRLLERRLKLNLGTLTVFSVDDASWTDFLIGLPKINRLNLQITLKNAKKSKTRMLARGATMKTR